MPCSTTRSRSAWRARWRASSRSRRNASASPTPIVEAQALRASDALKTALLRAVSHELRTPLTAIKAAVGALRGDQVQLGEEAVRELLEDVSIETDRLDRLVSDLLDVSRLQAGTASTALDWCEVDDLVRGAVAAGALARCRDAHRDRDRRTTCRSCTATRRRSSACSST